MTTTRNGLARGRSLSIIASMLVLAGCSDLAPLEANTCGNLVIEKEIGEDCDGEVGCSAPGSTYECRFTCEQSAEECATERGYHCGADAVCRRPMGEFVPLLTTTTVPARDMLVGDVNADGCAEVIVTATRSTTVHAFSSSVPSTCVESQQILQTNRPNPDEENTLPPPALADLEVGADTDRKSLLLPGRNQYADGLSLHYTSGGSTLAPVLFPRYIRGGPSVRTLTASLRGKSAIVLIEQAKGASTSDVSLILNPQWAPETFPGAFPGSVDDIAAIIAADVDLNPGAPPPLNEQCDEIIIARRSSPELELYKVCTDATMYGFTKYPYSPITLTNTTVRDSNATIVATDVNGDNLTDLLTNTTDQKVHVAFGLGDGRFHSKPPIPVPPAVADQKADVLNDLMATEAAKDGHIFVALEFDPNHPGIDYYAPPCPPQTDFTSPTCAYIAGGCEAVVADIDADGDDDVIISEGQGVDVAVHRQNGGAFNVTFLETACPPHHLGTGDFDGDGVVDFAFFDQTSKGPDAKTTVLSIAYGNAFAAPSAPKRSGRFDEANGLSVVQFGPPGTGAFIGITRAVGPDDKKGSALAVVEVGSERTVAAPYYLTADIMGAQSIDELNLIAQTAGLFRENGTKAPNPALAIVTRESTTYELWLVHSNEDSGSLRAAPRNESNGISLTSASMLAAIPRDGNATDDLLLIGTNEAIVYGVVKGGFDPKMQFPLTNVFPWSLGSNGQPKYAPRPLVEDVDGDAIKDVLVVSSTGALVGLFGTADGGFTENELIPAPTCWGKGGCGNYAATQMDVDNDGKLDLIVAGSELPDVSKSTSIAAYNVTTQGTTRGLSPIAGISINAEPLRSDTDYVALGADDIDGDGVADLVFMPSSNFFTVLRGRPEHE